ncbi:MAG: hypothetical protein SynsKO_10800 [Synoicihabitans sp.]
MRLPRQGRILLWSLLLWLASPQRDARAETVLHYKFQTWQEDDDRIRVDAHYAEAEQTWATGDKLRLVGLIDTITGATPSGQPAPPGEDQVPLSQLEDRREAYQVEYTRPFERTSFTLGYGNSKESDYLSDVWSLNSQVYFNQKNTTLLMGYARADDDITAAFLSRPRKKTVHDAIIGFTQVISPVTSVTANLTYGYQEGYISDPYKIVEKETEILPGLSLDLTFPENRPSSKKKLIGFFSVNHALEPLNAAIESSVRFLDDDWGIESQTFEFAWFQRLGEKLIVRPAVRYYRQSAADFYVIDLDNSPIVPPAEATGNAPYYSADYRLSSMETWMLGVKAVYDVTENLSVDVTLERYLMNGRGRLTSPSSFVDADVFTIGMRLWL